MYVSDITKTSKTTSTKAKKKTSSDGFSALIANDEITSTSEVSSPSSITPLLALQEMNIDEDKQVQSFETGEQALDLLNEYRKSLLIEIPAPNELFAMKEKLATIRSRSDNHALEAVVDEIELRVAVELAKIGE